MYKRSKYTVFTEGVFQFWVSDLRFQKTPPKSQFRNRITGLFDVPQ
jgi:hypothetical protein